MKIVIFAGKGGVGKSTTSSAFALSQAVEQNRRTLLIDNDGKRAHSVGKVLNFKRKKFVGNTINKTEIDNFFISIINSIRFKNIGVSKDKDIPVKEYLEQFPEDYGLLAICDMITTFFGIPTDIVSVSKFLSLVNVYHQAKESKMETITIDMEPTEGLERLINNVKLVVRSLKNLQKGSLMQTAIGKTYKDIGAFFKSPYIKNADFYVKRMEEATDALRNASFVLVSIPESSPVDQMFQLEELIMMFGGKVAGYAVNNFRGMDYEQRQIDEIFASSWRGKPTAIINHDENLCDPESGKRKETLLKAGSILNVFA